jgi:hypothetical protein
VDEVAGLSHWQGHCRQSAGILGVLAGEARPGPPSSRRQCRRPAAPASMSATSARATEPRNAIRATLLSERR